MALVDNAWYVNYGNGSSTGYYAIAAWATGTVTAAGALVRQLAAPAVGSERVFVCVVAGTTHATTEPTWTTTRGATTTDNTVTWQECTGIAAINGDATNTPSWTISATPPGGVKNTAVTKGQVIKRDSGASYQICTTAGTAGNGAEPSFSNTAGTTTADNTVTWTSLGVVGNFSAFGAPFARLASSFVSTWGQNGNSFYVGSNHAETQSTSMALNAPWNTALVPYIACVSTAAAPPTTTTTGATISSTGATSITIGSGSNNESYYEGIAFAPGTSNFVMCSANNGPFYITLNNCAITAGGSGVMQIAPAVASAKIRFINTTIAFGNAGNTLTMGASDFEWRGGSISGTVPTTLLVQANLRPAKVVFRGVDLSLLGSGKTLVAGTNAAGVQHLFVDCKLGSSVTLAASPASPGLMTDFINCDSGATNYFHNRYWYEGTQVVDTTIVRTGGATDGTQVISWKLVTTANSKWITPFESLPITFWNDSTSAITTLTIYGTTTGGGVPNDDDIWVEVEYLGDASSPQSSFRTTTKANNLAASAATNNSSDASTWGGGGSGNGFKIVVPSFTPGQKGPINIVVKVGKLSSTYYIDPKPSISGVTVSKSEVLAPGVYMNELSSGSSGGGSRSRIQTGF